MVNLLTSVIACDNICMSLVIETKHWKLGGYALFVPFSLPSIVVDALVI